MDLKTTTPIETGATLVASPMIDTFGRTISYLRLSVTDRCDFRCFYCMSEHQSFLPKRDLLSLEELERLCGAFIERGVRKIRLTGGEPLVRRGIMGLIENLGSHIQTGALDELTLTTNGSQLSRFADDLKACGVRRLNISIDTLDEDKFAEITRWGRLNQVLDGITAGLQAGLKIKLNVVALKGINDHEIPAMVEWAHGLGMDLTVIEVMPLGEVDVDRMDNFLALSELKQTLSDKWTLEDLPDNTGGPASYVRVKETGGRLGFITPFSNNFCDGCNRIRMTCTGQLYTCLGQDGVVDLRQPLRASPNNELLNEALNGAIANKPKGHDFDIKGGKMVGGVSRTMSVTGG